MVMDVIRREECSASASTGVGHQRRCLPVLKPLRLAIVRVAEELEKEDPIAVTKLFGVAPRTTAIFNLVRAALSGA